MSFSLAVIIDTLADKYDNMQSRYEWDEYVEADDSPYIDLGPEEIQKLNTIIQKQAQNDASNMIALTLQLNYSTDQKALVDLKNIQGPTNENEWISSDENNAEEIQPYAWDPRLARYDAFIINSENNGMSPLIIPFGSNTISSAFGEEAYAEYAAVVDIAKKTGEYKLEQVGNTWKISPKSGGTSSDDEMTTDYSKGSEKVFALDDNIKDMANLSDNYGAASLINPYTITKLAGGIVGIGGNTFENHMYDIRDSRRFYDITTNESESKAAGKQDFKTITNPTTSNIIMWSNKDKWGRTPYSFQDFVFCKYWNIIPNNRLITLRKYHAPTYDNLKFSNMHDTNVAFSPQATVLTYFGDDTGNTLSGLMSFSAGVKWRELTSDLNNVTGDTGSDPRAVIDNMFTQGGFGGVTGEASIIQQALGKAGSLSGKFLSFGKFTGLLSPGGYDGAKDQEVFDKVTGANIDPTEQLYSNKIIGPVNRVNSTMAREAGITFEQTLNVVCEYVARPIGGINSKAAILDILNNCLEIAAVDALWWGGGYRFMIHPRMYPFKREKMSNTFMEDLYQGRIFGANGALAHLVQGVKEFGTSEKGGSFEWSNVTSKLGEFIGESLGALGGLLQSISSTLFGSSSSLTQFLGKTTDMVSSKEQQDEGKSKLNTLFGNLNDMWRSKVIQNSVMPSISGMKSILTGEPVGNWHLTVGNPLNPMMVVGNLICKDVKVEWGEELGPDDFPMELKVTYTLQHGMARDKGAIQSMFNRGAGKSYVLPDFMKASSDYESKVDNYTGPGIGGKIDDSKGYYIPQYMHVSDMQKQAASQGLGTGGFQTVRMATPTSLQMSGNSDTTFVAKFTPVSINMATSNVLLKGHQTYLTQPGSRAIIRGNRATRKLLN